MFHVGLDVALKATQVCVMDAECKIIRETKVETDPERIALYLHDLKTPIGRVGLEAGPMSQWLWAGIAKAGYEVYCLDTRHVNAFLKTNNNKNDRNDARGIAEMMVIKRYKRIHVKTEESQRVRMLLNARRLANKGRVDVELSVRGMMRNFGYKVGAVSKAGWDGRIREMIEADPSMRVMVEPLLACRRTLREQYAVLHREAYQIARNDEICRRLMTCPGVGPIVALTFKSAIDVPERFRSSQAVGAHVGLAPRQYQSGEKDVKGRISKAGDAELRSVLVEAASVLLVKSRRACPFKEWADRVRERRGFKRATVAVARRMAVILHRMWVDGTDFRWTEEPEGAVA